MVRALVEALVMVPVVAKSLVPVALVKLNSGTVRLDIFPIVDQKFVPVRFVDEALVIVPVVEKKVGAVRMEVEALPKLVRPLTVSAPPR